MVHIGPQVVCRPCLRFGFGNHAGHLDVDVPRLGHLLHVFRPSCHFLFRNERLCDMVDNHLQVRQSALPVRCVAGRCCGRSSRSYGICAPLQFFQASQHIRAKQPPIVRFIVNGMSDAAEFSIRLQLVQRLADAGSVRSTQATTPRTMGCVERVQAARGLLREL